MEKIVITGPESTGKSTLTSQLAEFFNVTYTEEQARNYLNRLDREYNYADLLQIAIAQVEEEDKYREKAYPFILCDTDLLSIKIWSVFKYGKVDPEIVRIIEARHYDLYLLCKPDVPWEDDPLRENPYDRDLLFNRHIEEIERYGKSYEIIEGSWDDRFDFAKQSIETFMQKTTVISK